MSSNFSLVNPMNHIMKPQIYLILFIFVQATWAQLDPSTSVLVRKGASVEQEPQELDPSRYEVRKTQASKVKISSDGATAGTSSTGAAAGEVTTKKAVVSKVVKEVVVEEKPVEQNVEQKQEVIVRAETEKVNVPLTQQLQILIMGDPQEIESFRQQLHPLDTKNNVLEIALSPYLFYADSKSPYWYRNYNFSSLGVAGDARIWITPFFGIHGAYQSSLAAEISGNPAGTVRSPVNYQTTEGGLRFRKYFGAYRKAPQVSFALDYQDQRISPTGDGNQRLSLKTAGVRLGLEAQLPSTLAYSNVYRFAFIPRPVQSESGGAGVTSGNSPEVYTLEMGIGGLYQLDRYHQLFWRLDQRYQKTSYRGTASAADPESGLTPARVPVTESTTMFHIGIQFGQ